MNSNLILNLRTTVQAQIMQLEMEKRMRCGDGKDTEARGHSSNCQCVVINKKIRQLRLSITDITYEKEDV